MRRLMTLLTIGAFLMSSGFAVAGKKPVSNSTPTASNSAPMKEKSAKPVKVAKHFAKKGKKRKGK